MMLIIGTKTIFTLSSCNDLANVDADGSTLVSGHLDNNLRMWDTRTGILAWKLANQDAFQQYWPM